jgi:WD40 repeat protein
MKDVSADLQINDVFGDIRSALQQEPSRAAWGQLCTLLDKIDDAVLEDELLPYLRDHLRRWPHIERPMPDRWWQQLTDEGKEPRAQLSGWRLLWANMDDEEQEESGFDMFTALATCAIHPQLRTFLLGDAAEWHHNGGDIGRFDATTGRLETLLLSNNDYHGEPYDSAYSPDGQLVAFAPVEEMRHGAVHLWDETRARWIHSLSEHRNDEDELEDELEDGFEQVLLSFSHDSARLAYISSLHGIARIVDAKTGVIRAEFTDIHEPAAIALHPTRDLIAVLSRGEHGDTIGLLGEDTESSHTPIAPLAHKLLFSRDGATLAAAGQHLTTLALRDDALLQLHSIPLREPGSDEASWAPAIAIAALPHGGFRAVSVDPSGDGVCIADTLGSDLLTLSEPGQDPESVAITHDGQHILCGHVARVWLWSL